MCTWRKRSYSYGWVEWRLAGQGKTVSKASGQAQLHTTGDHMLKASKAGGLEAKQGFTGSGSDSK
jgi:hypothetical protein